MYDDANKSYLMTYNPDFALQSHLSYILHQADMMSTYIEGDMWDKPDEEKVEQEKENKEKVENIKVKFDELFAN